MEHVLRSWRIAAGLGDRIGLAESERAALYYVALLAWVGCVADSYEVATWFGDDIAFRADGYEVDLAGLPMLGFMLRHVGAGSPALHRLRLASTIITTRGGAVQRGLTSHCISTAHLAERFGLGPDVREPLKQMFARWDGKGVPPGVHGDEIAMSIRLFHVADVVEVHYHRHGVDAALEIARERRGTQFDPTIVDEFCRHAHDLLPTTEEETDWIALIDAEPGLRTRLAEPEIDTALEAVADFTDLRSPYFAGHSRGVADLAAAAAHETGLREPEVVLTRRAGLLHDIGSHGIPTTIWDKPGPLTTAERERVRLHPYYTERMLARPAMLAQLGAIAASHHERLDGSGYHRAHSGAAVPMAGRLIAAADAYHAMTEPRAYRPAMPAETAAKELRREVTTGRPRRRSGRRRTRCRRPQTQKASQRARRTSHHAKSKCSRSSPAAHPTAKSHTPSTSRQRRRGRTSSASTPRSARPPAPPRPSSQCSTASSTHHSTKGDSSDHAGQTAEGQSGNDHVVGIGP